MSRVGRLPIVLPSGVAVTIDGSRVVVKGPKGELERTFDGRMMINLNGNVLTIERPSDEKVVRALHGLTRSLLNNMVVGVSEGFSKELEIRGVGYKAEADPKGVKLLTPISAARCPINLPTARPAAFLPTPATDRSPDKSLAEASV